MLGGGLAVTLVAGLLLAPAEALALTVAHDAKRVMSSHEPSTGRGRAAR